MWSRFQKPAILVSMLIVLVVPLLVTGPLAAGLIAVALGVMLFSLIEAVLRRRSRQRE
jgi:Flp pilus assembly protein TadB